VMSADSYAHQVCGLRPSRSSPYRPHYRYRQWLTAVNSLAVVIHMRLIPSFLGDQIVRYRVVDKANASAGNFTLTERKSRGDALPAFTPRMPIRTCVVLRVIRRKLTTLNATTVRRRSSNPDIPLKLTPVRPRLRSVASSHCFAHSDYHGDAG